MSAFIPEWLVRCHWCANNYDRRSYLILAPHRYHWLCWFDSLRAKFDGSGGKGS